MRCRRPLVLLVSFLCAVQVMGAPAEPPVAGLFRITIDPSVRREPFTGRLYVAISKDRGGEPRHSMGDWFNGAQVFVTDVTGLTAGTGPAAGGAVFGAGAPGFPSSWDEFASPGAAEYTIQAVARVNMDCPSAGNGAGDLFSSPLTIRFDPARPADAVELRLAHSVQERPFPQNDLVKLVEIESPLLSKFYGRPVRTRASVLLPPGWQDDPARHYPTLYFITGFGGDCSTIYMLQGMMPAGAEGAPEVITVVPDPTCPLGHSVFADSENNGPRGESLIRELIPAVEEKYHGAGSGDRRYVTGISSGGWGSLWLQVAYPDEFNGVWSHCPDPVDFRDFQRINVYAESPPGGNMFRDESGNRRPLARSLDGGDGVSLWYDDFVRQETVLGPGGQIGSFEAVFSPRGPDGAPRPLFSRATGAIDPAVARAWEKYDIRLVLERNWPELGPKLKGKVHVYAGGKDTFYLEGSAALLKESFARLGSDAQVQIIEGMPHTIYSQGIVEMSRTIAANHPAKGAEPPVVSPGAPGSPVPPPSDAIVLLGGPELEQWTKMDGSPAGWIIAPGERGLATMTVAPGAGPVISKERFGDAQIHVEFCTPVDVEGRTGQDRGNSGVYVQGRYEVQVLDSFHNETYFDGQCGAIYKQHAPLVNVCRPPGEWQTYDILFHAPTFDAAGAETARATMTVLHNAVLIQDHAAITGPTGSAPFGEPSPEGGPIYLQDHGHTVSYRNIWVRRLN